MSDDQPQRIGKSKRQRTALACLSCRSRKCKCDGAQPVCNICVAMGFDCVYRKSARGSRRPVADIRSPTFNSRPGQIEERLHNLERLIHSVTSQLPSSPDTQNLSVISSTGEDLLLDRLPHIAGQEKQGANRYQSPSPSAPQDAGDTVDGMGAVIFADEIGSGFFGDTSNFGFTSHINQAFKLYARSRAESHTTDEISIDATADISRPPTPLSRVSVPVKNIITTDLHGLPPIAETILLVNLFFTEFGLLFPYISRKAVLDGIENLARPGSTIVRRSWLCLLHAIVAFASDYSSRHERKENDVSQAESFIEKALFLVPDVSQQPANIEMLQALLLLTQYLQGTRSCSLFSHYQRRTVQIAFQVGAHCENPFTEESLLEYETRKRCWHMTFILDKSMSIHFGRPPSIPNTHLRVALPIDKSLDELECLDDDDPSLHDTLSPTSGYIHTIKLFYILSDILHEVYQDNLSPGKSVSSLQIYQSIGSIEWKLQEWRRDLPTLLRIRKPAEMTITSPSQFDRLSIVLTLRYLFARLLLHRASLTRILDRLGSHTGAENHNPADAGDFFQKSSISSLEACVASAVELVEIMHTLSSSGHRMLMSWWFSVYYVFSAILVIFASLLIKRHHDIVFSGLEPQQGRQVFQQALYSIQRFGPETSITIRCRKYIQSLKKVADALGLFSDETIDNWDAGDFGNAGLLSLTMPNLFPFDVEDMDNMTFQDAEHAY